MATNAPLQYKHVRRMDVTSRIVLVLALSSFALILFIHDSAMDVNLFVAGMISAVLALTLRIKATKMYIHFKEDERKRSANAH